MPLPVQTDNNSYFNGDPQTFPIKNLDIIDRGPVIIPPIFPFSFRGLLVIGVIVFIIVYVLIENK